MKRDINNYYFITREVGGGFKAHFGLLYYTYTFSLEETRKLNEITGAKLNSRYGYSTDYLAELLHCKDNLRAVTKNWNPS